MDKREFLKASGALGVLGLMPFGKILAGGENAKKIAGTGCTLIPTETAGPFPLDLSANTFYFRQDVREDRTGVPFNLKLKIVGVDNCEPMQNVRVNIWHCSKDGLYSGYDNNMNAGQAGLTYLRGYQMTDSNGEVDFTTIFPGWYNGRVCHIHFQVFVNSSYAAISQLTFDITAKNAIYTANPSLYLQGTDPTNPANDNVFSDGYTYQIASLTANQNGGYDGYLEVAIQGSGVTGNEEKQTDKQFTLGQNYPNPYHGQTTIPIDLKQPGDLKIDLYDLSGRIVKTITKPGLSTGQHNVDLNMDALGLSTANYVYQVELINSSGTYRTCKMMTAVK